MVGRIYPSTTEHILTIKTTQYAINLKTIDVVRFAGVAVGMPLLLTSMWMALMRSKPRAMIRINSALFMLLLVTTVAINAYYGAYYSMALGCLGLWLGVRIIKDKNGENFCVACLQVVNRILNRYPSTVFIPIVAVLVAAAAIIPAFLGLHYAHSQAVDPNTAIDLSRGGAVGLMIAFLFSIFWTVECIYNIVHMTICGTVASYYFFREDERSEHATWHALKRACKLVCFRSAYMYTIRTSLVVFHCLYSVNNVYLCMYASKWVGK